MPHRCQLCAGDSSFSPACSVPSIAHPSIADHMTPSSMLAQSACSTASLPTGWPQLPRRSQQARGWVRQPGQDTAHTRLTPPARRRVVKAQAAVAAAGQGRADLEALLQAQSQQLQAQSELLQSQSQLNSPSQQLQAELQSSASGVQLPTDITVEQAATAASQARLAASTSALGDAPPLHLDAGCDGALCCGSCSGAQGAWHAAVVDALSFTLLLVVQSSFPICPWMPNQ